MTLVTESKKTQKMTDSEKKHENDVTRDFLIKSQSHDKKSQSHDILGVGSLFYTRSRNLTNTHSNI